MSVIRIAAAVAAAACVLPAASPAHGATGGAGASSAGSSSAGSSSAGSSSAGMLDLSWRLQPSGVTARLRGLSVVDHRVAWASGSAGTVLRTVDGGRSWQNVSPPGTADLQFRDIEGFDADTAVILSIGSGEASRVYRTTDGGRSWVETFRNADPAAFYDCMAFFDHRRGLALSDPVDERFRILATEDGGRSWAVVDPAGMPPALDDEFAFAASGQCLVTAGGRHAYFGTGVAGEARVFRSADGGRTWRVATTPMASGEASGIFALAFRGPRHGIAVGGDFRAGAPSPDALATTADGGRSWTLAPRPPGEYRSGVALLPYGFAAIAVGPTGSDLTVDDGRSWHRFDGGSFDTVDCAADGACWASGEQGRIAGLNLSR